MKKPIFGGRVLGAVFLGAGLLSGCGEDASPPSVSPPIYDPNEKGVSTQEALLGDWVTVEDDERNRRRGADSLEVVWSIDQNTIRQTLTCSFYQGPRKVEIESTSRIRYRVRDGIIEIGAGAVNDPRTASRYRCRNRLIPGMRIMSCFRL